MELDIGLEAFNISELGRTRNIHLNWYCDVIVLKFLKQVVPTSNATLYKLYELFHNKTIPECSRAEHEELATIYKSQIERFVLDQVTNRINHIVRRWKAVIANPEYRFLFRIPLKCRVPFDNLLTLKKQNVQGLLDDGEVFKLFVHDLVEASKPKTTLNYDRADVFERVTFDNFVAYTSIVQEYISKKFTNKDGQAFNKETFTADIRDVVTCIYSILCLCIPNYETEDGEWRTFFDKEIHLNAQKELSDDILYALKNCSEISPEEAVCLSDTRVLSTKDVERSTLDIISDVYRYLVTVAYQSTIPIQGVN